MSPRSNGSVFAKSVFPVTLWKITIVKYENHVMVMVDSGTSKGGFVFEQGKKTEMHR